MPQEINKISDRQGPYKVGTPLRTLVLCLGSLAVMVVWPLLGILLTRSLFDYPSEAFMLFGGITLFQLMFLALFGSLPSDVFAALLMLVWVTVALAPGICLRRHLVTRWALGCLFGSQTAFSFGQAVMGAMLLIGKSV